jgi:hypothetical protein
MRSKRTGAETADDCGAYAAFSLCLCAGVITEPISPIRKHLIGSPERLAVENNTRGAGMNEVGNAFRFTGINHGLGAADIDTFVVCAGSPDTSFRGNMEDGLAAACGLADVLAVRDFTGKEFYATCG